MAVKVASLLRLSTMGQVKRQNGDNEPDLPAQRQAIAEFLATKPDWVHVKEYQEAGVSAFKLSAEDRDVLQDALKDAAAGLWSVLVVFKADRLSRNSTEYPLVIDLLRRRGVEVWSVADTPGGKRLALDSQMDKFMRFLEGWQAETESVNTSVRTKARKRQLADTGRWIGGTCPYGYSLAAKRDANGEPVIVGGRPVRELVVNVDTSPIVRMMFDWYIGGFGDQNIAGRLNEMSIPSPTGVAWSRQGVKSVLTNPTYSGVMVHHRSRKLRKAGADQVTAKGVHEPLISVDVWEKACDLRRNRLALHGRQTISEHLFTGVLRCGSCGGPMGGARWSWKVVSGEKRRNQGYRCITWIERKQCTSRRYLAQAVEDAFLVAIERLAMPVGLRAFLEREDTEQRDQLRAAQEARTQTLKQVQTIDRALERLDRAYFEVGTVTDTEYRAKKEEYLERKRSLEEELSKPLPQAQARNFDELTKLAGEIRHTWAHLTMEERKALVLNLMAAYSLTAILHRDGRVELRSRTAQ